VNPQKEDGRNLGMKGVQSVSFGVSGASRSAVFSASVAGVPLATRFATTASFVVGV
jgi:hypothetical protein